MAASVWKMWNGITKSQLPTLFSKQFYQNFYLPSAGLRRKNVMPPVTDEDYQRWRSFERPTSREVVQEAGVHGQIHDDVFKSINAQIENKTHGRLFAVIHITGKQFKVTSEDIIILQGQFAAKDGTNLRLEKVLMVGSRDFTLIGRPLLNKDLVRIDASVIEKTFSHVKTWFHMIKRKRHRRMRFLRTPFTMLRINSIEINGLVNETKDVEGLEDRII